MNPGVAIVGCGLIGRNARRGDARLVACADVDRAAAEGLARARVGAEASVDWRAAIDRADVAIVIVATTSEALADIARGAIEPANTS